MELVEVEAVPASAATDLSYVPEWREHTIVFRLESGRVVTVPARKYGTLAVHQTWSMRGKDVSVGVFGVKDWTVAHAPSTLSVGRCDTQDEAEAQAEWLWGACPAVWASGEVNKSLLPPEVVRWCVDNQV